MKCRGESALKPSVSLDRGVKGLGFKEISIWQNRVKNSSCVKICFPIVFIRCCFSDLTVAPQRQP